MITIELTEREALRIRLALTYRADYMIEHNNLRLAKEYDGIYAKIAEQSRKG